jgi:hypothetical protein
VPQILTTNRVGGMSTTSPAIDAARQSKLNKHFGSIVNGKKIVSNYRDAGLIIEAICAQQDPTTCVTRLIGGGLPSLKAAMHALPTLTFFNGPADALLKYLQAPTLKSICGGDYLRQVVIEMVEPPIFWLPFVRAFQDGSLDPPAQQSFGWLLLELITLPTEKASQYVELAQEASIQKRLIDSPHVEIRTLGHRIKHVVSTVTAAATFDGYGGPGGRHDNDFADFRQITILPTADELSSQEKPFLRLANAMEEADEDGRLAIHLDNQFRLLREELLAEMREELQIALGIKKKKHRGMVVDNLEITGFDFRQSWGMRLQCKKDFGQLSKLQDAKSRKKFFISNPNIFKHNTLACLLIDNEVVAFPTICRDKDLDILASKPPIVTLQFNGKQSAAKVFLKLKTGTNIKLVQIDTAVFAFEPILLRLQAIKEVELKDELLSWEPGTPIGWTSSVPENVLRKIRGNPSQDLRGLLQSASKDAIKLDDSQCASLIMGLEQRVSLIQGPPGIPLPSRTCYCRMLIAVHRDGKVVYRSNPGQNYTYVYQQDDSRRMLYQSRTEPVLGGFDGQRNPRKRHGPPWIGGQVHCKDETSYAQH